MRMDLIQPFINSADAVLAQGLESPISIENLTMEEEAYRRKGIAAEVCLTGEIEGRIIFDVDQEAAAQLASRLAGVSVSETNDELIREAVCELANQIIGNAVTTLNTRDSIFMFAPPHFTLPSKAAKAVKTRRPGDGLQNFKRKCLYECGIALPPPPGRGPGCGRGVGLQSAAAPGTQHFHPAFFFNDIKFSTNSVESS